MNRQTIIIVAVAVALVHAVFFYAAMHVRSRVATKPPERPTFGVADATYEESGTGEKIHYREIRVSTKLADPALVERLKAEIAAKSTAPATP